MLKAIWEGAVFALAMWLIFGVLYAFGG